MGICGWCVVDPDANTVTASIGHFTVFAIIGREKAAFEFANLSIFPFMVDSGESVTITVEVTNTGGLQGSCIVTLLIDGSEEETKEVTLEPGVSDIVTFTLTRDIAGTYTVEIGGLTDEFVVARGLGPGAWAGIGVGSLLLLVLLGLSIWSITRRRAQRATR